MPRLPEREVASTKAVGTAAEDPAHAGPNGAPRLPGGSGVNVGFSPCG
ncbi:MAG: hypothetical protein RLZZ184_2939 [Cyanobacteriota bacterium]